MDYAGFVAIPRFKSFATTDGDRLALIEQFATESTADARAWVREDVLERGTALLIAHRLQLYDGQALAVSTTGSAGAVLGQLTSVSESMGSRSASFGAITGKTREELLARTEYGLELLELMRRYRREPIIGFVW